MRKVRICLTFDVPLGNDDAPAYDEINKKRARTEYLTFLRDPVAYIRYALGGGSWISHSSYRFVDDELPGGDRIE